jgi:hypothetical protein
MKKNILLGTIALLAGSLIAADSSPKEDVIAAAKKLADQSNYSWKSTLDLGANSQFTPGPTEGKTEKDGLTWLSVSFNDNTSEGVMKGTKVVVKTEEGWKTAEEAGGGGGGGGGGFNPGGFMARRMQSLKTPAAEVEDLVSKAKEIKKDGDAFSGDMTEEGAKALLTAGGFGRRGGQAPPPATDAKGSMKFWIKDGALTKYEFKVSGKREIQGEVRDIERTTKVEIKDVDTTKLTVPEEAKKKLS